MIASSCPPSRDYPDTPSAADHVQAVIAALARRLDQRIAAERDSLGDDLQAGRDVLAAALELERLIAEIDHSLNRGGGIACDLVFRRVLAVVGRAGILV